MMMTTMGADFLPQTPEGRLLSLLLATYAFAVWGYVTATIATLFLRGTREKAGPSSEAQIAALTSEVRKLREELMLLKGRVAH
jgi:voltage-gated potassium channel